MKGVGMRDRKTKPRKQRKETDPRLSTGTGHQAEEPSRGAGEDQDTVNGGKVWTV